MEQKIDFTGFLSHWLFDFHQPERDFWKNMNPVRLNALIEAYTKKPKQEEPSLGSIFIGGAHGG